MCLMIILCRPGDDGSSDTIGGVLDNLVLPDPED